LLRKSVGVTNAQLEARGEFLLANIHMSRRFEGIVDVYTGFGYEQLTARSSYRYTLPQQVQIQLRLLRELPDGSAVRDPETRYSRRDHRIVTRCRSKCRSRVCYSVGCAMGASCAALKTATPAQTSCRKAPQR